MTFNDFTNEWNGKYVDYDGVYNAQCTDLMRQFVKEFYGLDPYKAIPTTGNAKDIYNNFKDNGFFKKIKNTPLFVPQQADIIFWGTYPFVTGLAGHVALFSGGNVKRFVAFGQNYGKPNFCRYQNYDYRGVLGVFRKI